MRHPAGVAPHRPTAHRPAKPPLQKADVVPLFGSLIGAGVGLVTLVLKAILAPLVIAVGLGCRRCIRGWPGQARP